MAKSTNCNTGDTLGYPGNKIDADVDRAQHQSVQKYCGKTRADAGQIQFARVNARTLGQLLQKDRFTGGANAHVAVADGFIEGK